MTPGIFWLDLGEGTRLGFDVAQGLDLRHVVFGGVDLAPRAAGVWEPGSRRPLDGFMFTCGPDHIRQPVSETTADGTTVNWPLHGSFVGSSAERICFEETRAGYALGAFVAVNAADGATYEIQRRYDISKAPLTICLTDSISGIGRSLIRPMIMYHVNFEGRFLGKGAAVSASAWAAGIPRHEGVERHCARFTPSEARIVLTQAPVAAVTVATRSETLGWLQVWRQKSALGEIVSVEPVSHALLPRAELAARGLLNALGPGETREYSMQLRFLAQSVSR